ncbi:sulfatase [Algisphaera agarilytica]|uniref:Arylsulfatase A-like enzyme n=1 Tax=Algisphaera agarilytica TaxID=1385975 RepID=A0A7X0LLM0_9BACT|nr:sulfatase [Algisphaera agarilytica]MBB6431054.1 arylsulfatase A-like enzyme [Algisphaera agarilytica]
MKYDSRCPWACLLALAVLFAALPISNAAAKDQPNFIVIVADDLGWRDLGFMGSDYHRTPHLDRLASGGLVFTQAYANAPMCAPTRAAILSGMYSPRTGVYTVGGGGGRGQSDGPDLSKLALTTPRNQSSLDSDITTLPEALQQAGYTTGHVGKWHLGRTSGRTGPTSHGFDTSVGASRGGGTRTYYAPYGIADLDETAKDGEYITDRLTDEAVGFIEENKGGPFFLWLAHYAVHNPIEPDPAVLRDVNRWPTDEQHDNAEYAAMLVSLDNSVGRIMESLDAQGLADNTVVVFVSDNGGSDRTTNNAPLRSGKGSLYEGGVRIPCVVHYPGVVEAGRKTDEPVLLFDLYPTFLDLSGAKAPRQQAVDGESWRPILEGQSSLNENRPLVWYIPTYSTTPRGSISHGPRAVVRKGDWKLLYDFESKESELYNIADDLGESKDLAKSKTTTVRSLERELEKWLKATDADVPAANPDYDPDTADQPRRRNRDR